MVTMNRKIVFLTGRQRAGKDTVADYLVEHFGFYKIAIADKIKDVAKDLFFMEEKDRGLLIEIGQKMREIRSGVWLEYLLRTIPEDKNKIVIPDVRLPKEYEILCEMGAISVKVCSDVEYRKKRQGYNPEFEYDATEGALEKYKHNFAVFNNYSEIEPLLEEANILGRNLQTYGENGVDKSVSLGSVL
jgi:hypothetical protein